MLTAISSIVVALALLVGGSGITAYAAQDSLPNETLYPVKLFLEDVRFDLTGNSQKRVAILTSFANNRVDEIVGLDLQGQNVPDSVMTNLQMNLSLMLHYAAEMAEGDAVKTLQQIQQNLRTQEQLMVMLGQPDHMNPLMLQLRTMLQNQSQVIQQGLDDPLQFQQIFGRQVEHSPGGPSQNLGGQNQDNNFDCLDSSCTPVQDGSGPGNSNGNGGSQNGNGAGSEGNGAPVPGGNNPDAGSGQQGEPAKDGDQGNDAGNNGNSGASSPGEPGNNVDSSGSGSEGQSSGSGNQGSGNGENSGNQNDSGSNGGDDDNSDSNGNKGNK